MDKHDTANIYSDYILINCHKIELCHIRRYCGKLF